jgi:hypothetical protein
MTGNAQHDIRALAELGGEFRRVAREDPQVTGAMGRGRLVAGGAALLLALAVFSFTPPGRAAADWLAERVGIGEPGGAPTLTEFREFTTEGTIGEGQPAYVLATGPAPYGGRYEFITFRNRRDGTHCFEVNLLRSGGRVGGSYGGPCGPIPEAGLSLDSTGGNAGPDEVLQTAIGRASLDVATVEVQYDGQQREAELTLVEDDLAEELGFEGSFQVFAEFFTDQGGTLRVTGRDAAGNVVATESVRIPDFYADSRKLCHRLRASAERGRTSEKKADAFCGMFAQLKAE